MIYLPSEYRVNTVEELQTWYEKGVLTFTEFLALALLPIKRG